MMKRRGADYVRQGDLFEMPVEHQIPRSPGIYRIRNRLTGAVYIGSAKNLQNRQWRHWCQLRRGTHLNLPLQNAWDKDGERCFTFQVIEQCSKERLLEREQHWLDDYRSTCGKVYNVREKATSNLGIKASEETKRKLSEGLRQRYSNAAERAKLSAAMTRYLSDPAAKAEWVEVRKRHWHNLAARAEAREKRNRYCADPANKPKLHEAAKKTWQTRRRRALSDASIGAKRSEAVKKAWVTRRKPKPGTQLSLFW
jgi:group I intron endonuclease